MKRCQASVFMIGGVFLILLLMAVIIIVAITMPDPEAFSRQLIDQGVTEDSMNRLVEYCLGQEIKEPITQIGLAGGTLNLSDVQAHGRTYHGIRYRTVCVPHEGSQYCVARMITISDIEEELARAIENRLENCLDISYIEEKGYSVSLGEKEAEITIGRSTVSIRLRLPMVISGSDAEFTISDFSTTINHPLGMAYRLMLDIINKEVTQGFFDKDAWMRTHMMFTILKHKPYPYVLYSLSRDGFQFNFGLEMQDRASRPGRDFLQPEQYGCCHVQQQCFKNVDHFTCNVKGGSYIRSPHCTCTEHFAGEAVQQTYAACGTKQHGESWCEQHGEIGGRDIVFTCIDGRTIQEPCKDFHEEVCVERNNEETDIQTALCKPNRWQDCARCTTEECCMNEELRDCIWQTPAYTVIEELPIPKCLPRQPPGFRFWDGAGQEICNLGTTYARCSGYNCPEAWIQHASATCSFLGDCGMNRNVYGAITTSGYLETDPLHTAVFTPRERQPFSEDARQAALLVTEARESLNLIPALLSTGLNYLNDASRNRRMILDYSICGLWQAPLEEQPCYHCGTWGPCSEYQCHSLGQDCIYREEEGFPICERRTGLQEEFDITLTAPYAIEEDTVHLEGTTLQGYRIAEPLPPFEQVVLTLETTAPTTCKITYLPDLPFAETPAIWFGEPSYNTSHTVSLRLPESIDMPEELFERLGVASLEELFTLITQNDAILRNAFDSEFVSVLERAQSGLARRAYVAALLNITIASLDNNTYYTFIRCSDRSGSENPEPVFLSFTIDEAYSDTKPPEVVATIPQNRSEIRELPYELQIYLDKPAECKLSPQDQAFGIMPTYFDCETSPMRMSAVAGGSYRCTTTTDILHPYIRCADNPPRIEEYHINLRDEPDFGTATYHQEGRSITLPAADLRGTTVFLPEHETLYELSFIVNAEQCYFGYTQNIDTMIPLQCAAVTDANWSRHGRLNCTQEVVPAARQAYITCIDQIASERNIHQESIQLQYAHAEDLAIIQAFPEQDARIWGTTELRVTVNRDIHDNTVQCGYTTTYEEATREEFQVMWEHGAYQFTRNILLPAGEHEVTFRCRDASGSLDEHTTRFLVE